LVRASRSAGGRSRPSSMDRRRRAWMVPPGVEGMGGWAFWSTANPVICHGIDFSLASCVLANTSPSRSMSIQLRLGGWLRRRYHKNVRLLRHSSYYLGALEIDNKRESERERERNEDDKERCSCSRERHGLDETQICSTVARRDACRRTEKAEPTRSCTSCDPICITGRSSPFWRAVM